MKTILLHLNLLNKIFISIYVLILLKKIIFISYKQPCKDFAFRWIKNTIYLIIFELKNYLNIKKILLLYLQNKYNLYNNFNLLL